MTTLSFEQSSETQKVDVPAFAGIIAFAIFGGIMALQEHFATDAIGYQFLIPEEVNQFTMQRVSSLSDVWVSQVNHWHTVNGRFICHFLVQLFCGIFPQWLWAVANGLIYGYLAWLCGRNTRAFGQGVWIGAMTLLVTLPWLAFSPPMQINYVWAYALEMTFINAFFSDRKWFDPQDKAKSAALTVGWLALAFCAGQWNEAFVIPIGVGLLALFIYRRGRFTAHEWIGTIAFAAGALTLCLAPGNFVRLADTTKDGFNIVDYARRVLIGLYPLCAGIVIVLLLFSWKGLKAFVCGADTRKSGICLFLGAMVITSYILGLTLGFISENRLVACVGLGFVVLFNLIGREQTPRLTGLTFLMALGILCGASRIRRAQGRNERYDLYDEMYRQSEDGRIYVPVSLLEKDWREDRFASFFITYQRKSEDPDAPAIKILPEEVQTVDKDADYNAIIPLSDRAYLFVRSETQPARFLLKRRLGLPGTAMTLPISDRELDFDSDSNDISIDTLRHVRLGLYINERPYVDAVPYMVE